MGFLATALAGFTKAADASKAIGSSPANTANDPNSQRNQQAIPQQPLLNYGLQPQQFGYQFGPQGVRLGQY
ncbi:MAG TPA: hypothetical protein VFR76_07020 [Verrucomicrobiae bacterium]|nr:hypothetical protein [Verrucomicrobiae bacterium]